MKKIFYIFSLISLCAGCSSGASPLLKNIYKNYFTIGAAFNEGSLRNELVSHFNSLTSENEMKWISLHPSEDVYTFEKADVYIKFAKDHKLGVRGHTLVWHEAVDEEIFKETPERILQIEENHISEVVTHFKDDVYCWDVVNEVIDDGNDPLIDDGVTSNIYRQSNWYKACGKEFISTAFIKADQVLKDLGIRDKVKLFYNDYDNAKEVKRSKTVAMINWLQENNVPIDGIGLQCHYHLGSFDPIALEDAIIEYSNLGLEVQITEFDCQIYDTSLSEIEEYGTYSKVPKEALKVQATIYDRAFEIFRKHKDKITNVTFWGVSDENNYFKDNPNLGNRTDYPYVFDVNHEYKPAYYLIANFKDGK